MRIVMPALLPQAEPIDLPDDLGTFLLAWAAVSARDEEATREALAFAATELQERESHRIGHSLYRILSPGGQAWLRGLI